MTCGNYTKNVIRKRKWARKVRRTYPIDFGILESYDKWRGSNSIQIAVPKSLVVAIYEKSCTENAADVEQCAGEKDKQFADIADDIHTFGSKLDARLEARSTET
jgi:hypothetical protein